MNSNIKRCISFFIEGIIIVTTCCAIAACGATTETEKVEANNDRTTITLAGVGGGGGYTINCYIIKDNETGSEFLYTICENAARSTNLVQIRKDEENNE